MKPHPSFSSLSALVLPLVVALSGVSALGAAGCATTRYGYRPAAINASNEAGYPAAHYVVPADAPQGEAFVTSFGTRDGGQGTQGSQLVHVRLAVANQTGAASWQIDPGKLLLKPSAGVAQRPDFMEIDGAQNGNTEVARGQRRVLDLYYRMPAGAPDANAPPAFDFSWEVNLDGKVFAEHTPFSREPYDEYERETRSYVAVGVAPPWWWAGYGPYFWGPYGWPYYGYGPYVGFGIGYRGYYGPRYYGGGHVGHYGRAGGGGGGGRIGPTVRGRSR